MLQLNFLPPKLRDQLMPFQRDGILFGVRKNGRCLIADEMGLGKTLQALSLAYYYREEWPLLVVVPSSLRYSWIEEIEKWFPEIIPHKINLIETGADVSDISSALITIVTYGLLRHPSAVLVREALVNQAFKVVIADESHNIKNRKAAGTKYLVPLLQRAIRKILLTGTPALNCPEELYPQLEAINPGEFGNWSQFAKRFCDAQFKFFGRQRRWVTNGASNLEELQTMLTGSLLIRRLKKDVLPQLPPKQRQKIVFKLKESDVKKEVDAIMDELEHTVRRSDMSLGAVLSGKGGAVATYGSSNDLQTSSNNTFEGEDKPGGSSMEMYQLLSRLSTVTCRAKIGPVKEYVKLLCENKDLKFIIFAHHFVMLDGITEQLLDSNVKYIRIDGSVLPQDRHYLVRQFQTDSETRVAVLSILAAGVGLTLTAASVVVFAELNWTPGILDQCEDRAHRIGQQGTVHVHYLVASGTLDDWVWSSLSRKTTVVSITLNGEKKLLQMDSANSEQTDCLNNANAYVPFDNSHANITSILHTPLQTGQKTVLDFFSNSPKFADEFVRSAKAQVKTSCSNPLNSACTLDKGKEKAFNVIDLSDDELPSVEIGKSPRNAAMNEIDNEDFDVFKTRNPMKSAGFGKKRFKENVKIIEPKKSTEINISNNTSKSKTNRSHVSSVQCASEGINITDCTDNDELPNLNVYQTSTDDHKSLVTDVMTLSKSLNQHEDSCTLLNICTTNYSCSKTTSSSNTDIFTTPTSGKRKYTAVGVSHSSNNEGDDDTGWSCLACTFINHVTLPACEICTTPKMSSAKRRNISWHNNDSVNTPLRYNNDSPSSISSTARYATRNSPEINDNKCLEISEEGVRNVFSLPAGASANFSELATETPIDDNDITECDSSSGTLSNELVEDCHSDDIDNDGVFAVKNCNTYSTSSINIIPSLNSPSKGNAEFSSMPAQHDSISAACDSQLKLSEEITDLDTELPFAANILCGPTSDSSKGNEQRWSCVKCGVLNFAHDVECDGCFKPRPETLSISCSEGNKIKDASHCSNATIRRSNDVIDQNAGVSTDKVVDLDNLPSYESFQFSCSLNTTRIYVYNQAGDSIGANFTPLDVELENFSELSPLLLKPKHLQLLKRFVRAWKSLSATKRRVVVRSGLVFLDPTVAYQQIRVGAASVSKQRNMTRVACNQRSLDQAKETGGSTRHIMKPVNKSSVRDAKEQLVISTKQKEVLNNELTSDVKEGQKIITNDANEDLSLINLKGYVQTVDASGCPLCLQCQAPYKTHLVAQSTLDKNAWQTRLCSKRCIQQFWTRRYRDYSVRQVFESEHGICQMCHFDAHAFFLRIKATASIEKRAKLIQESKYGSLSSATKERMARQPNQGLFWEVDHELAVAAGGGECDLDNLRTLCTLCHRSVTKQQHKDRARLRLNQAAATCMDIKAFFKPK